MRYETEQDGFKLFFK